MITLRPNTAKVQRRATTGTTSNTGAPVPTTPITVYAALPCFIENVPRQSQIDVAIGSQPVVEQLHLFYADGVNVNGYTAGETVVYKGQNLIVAANLRSAFPDIRDGDLITMETGSTFLVIGPPQLYYDVFPNIQAHLQLGKGW